MCISVCNQVLINNQEPNFGVRRLALDQAAAALEPTIYPASKSGDELVN